MNKEKREALKRYIEKNKIIDLYSKHKINTTEDRWEKGIEHHPKSEELMEHLKELDLVFNDDSFCFKLVVMAITVNN